MEVARIRKWVDLQFYFILRSPFSKATACHTSCRLGLQCPRRVRQLRRHPGLRVESWKQSFAADIAALDPCQEQEQELPTPSAPAPPSDCTDLAAPAGWELGRGTGKAKQQSSKAWENRAFFAFSVECN